MLTMLPSNVLNRVGALTFLIFGAQYPACVCHCQRFTYVITDIRA
jgi:hypothetical protein